MNPGFESDDALPPTPLASLEPGDPYFAAEGARLDWVIHKRLWNFARRVLLPEWEQLDQREGTVEVKKNYHRTVWRVPSECGELFVKRFRLQSAARHLKSLILPSKAMREWSNARRVYSALIPTAEPAFVAERRRMGFLLDSCVGFFKVAGSRNYALALDEARALPGSESKARRREYAERIASISHKLFEIGAIHYDYHLGNLLVDGQGQLYVIDLDAILFVGRPFRWQKTRVLAQMALSHAPFDREKRRFARDEVHWLCESYASLDSSLGDAHSLEQKILEVAWELEQRRLRSRDRRCLVNSRDYALEGSWKRPIYRRRELSPEDIEVACAAPAIETIHDSGRSKVEIIAAPPSLAASIAEARGLSEAPKTIIRKHTWSRNLGSSLGFALQGSKGMRSWKAARALEVRGLPTAHHLALVEERPGLLWPDSATVFMEHIEGCWELHKYLVEVLGPGPESGGAPLATRHNLISELAELLVRMQETGICHHDLAVQNILVRPRGDGSHALFLVDLDTVELRSLQRRDRLRNLIHLADLPPAASLRDKLRFFRLYLKMGGRALLATELRDFGIRELKREIGRQLQKRHEAKARRMAKKSMVRGEPAED